MLKTRSRYLRNVAHRVHHLGLELVPRDALEVLGDENPLFVGVELEILPERLRHLGAQRGVIERIESGERAVRGLAQVLPGDVVAAAGSELLVPGQTVVGSGAREHARADELVLGRAAGVEVSEVRGDERFVDAFRGSDPFRLHLGVEPGNDHVEVVLEGHLDGLLERQRRRARLGRGRALGGRGAGDETPKGR
jgi:hypothetical protein